MIEIVTSYVPSSPSSRSIRHLLLTAITAWLAVAAIDVAAAPPNVVAKSWIVVDSGSGQTLVEHDADKELQPASLTKLMTAYLALAALKRGDMRWDEQIEILRSDVEPVHSDEARMHLVPGQHVSVRKLIEGLIAASANDAALVLARRVGGTVEGFLGLMNETAHALHMEHSHFATPSGITTPGNYSTARDLSILAQRITTDFPEYYSFSAEQYFSYGTFKKRNKNWLMRDDPTVDGMKTGRTNAAGFCIVASAKRVQAAPHSERRVFATILGAPTAKARIDGAGRLIDFAFSSFQDVSVQNGTSQQVISRPLVR